MAIGGDYTIGQGPPQKTTTRIRSSLLKPEAEHSIYSQFQS
jgi:hypothetical protein